MIDRTPEQWEVIERLRVFLNAEKAAGRFRAYSGWISSDNMDQLCPCDTSTFIEEFQQVGLNAEEAKEEIHIMKTVALCPEPTPEQWDRLRRLVGPLFDPSYRHLPARDPYEDSVVYYVENSGLIKIGTSYQVDRRVEVLKGRLLATEPGSYDLERQRHREFAESRVGRTEWFQPTAALREHIAALQTSA